MPRLNYVAQISAGVVLLILCAWYAAGLPEIYGFYWNVPVPLPTATHFALLAFVPLTLVALLALSVFLLRSSKLGDPTLQEKTWIAILATFIALILADFGLCGPLRSMNNLPFSTHPARGLSCAYDAPPTLIPCACYGPIGEYIQFLERAI